MRLRPETAEELCFHRGEYRERATIRISRSEQQRRAAPKDSAAFGHSGCFTKQVAAACCSRTIVRPSPISLLTYFRRSHLLAGCVQAGLFSTTRTATAPKCSLSPLCNLSVHRNGFVYTGVGAPTSHGVMANWNPESVGELQSNHRRVK
jgi:hypothetical protein